MPWLRRLTDDVHEAGAAVMCQVTHLGRRTSNFTGDWLPLVYPSPLREPAHRSFPKVAEPWDLDRIVADYAAAAQRCAGGRARRHRAAVLRPPPRRLPLARHEPPRTTSSAATSRRALAFPRRVVRAVRAAVGPDFVVGIRMSMDEDDPDGLGRDEALQALERVRRRRHRLPQRHQGDDRERRDPGARDPVDGHALGAVPRLRRRDQARRRDPGDARLADLRRRHGAARDPRRACSTWSG